ncbi:MAG: aminoacyl-tRNA hydrolase [Deltaproteobacteria bacterium]|nr:aminoacyl-tRNA hydrolase [Deltaproteobacteria bacterium]TLN05080.1 MAG: aminoacyl-tRNA hydrolase [bacterium]
MAVKLIVGLGNPGARYQWTRHNAGFMVLDRLSHLAGISVAKKSSSSLFGEGFWQGQRLILLKPQTFMNLSGRSVAEVARFHKIPGKDIIVVHDDLDISFGHVRLKKGGGHGGHNGLRSIIADFGDRDFLRLRIGIGRPVRGDVVDYVLNPFSPVEMKDLAAVLDGAVEILESLFSDGLEKTMSLHNNRDLLAV